MANSCLLKDELFDLGLLYCEKCGKAETEETRKKLRSNPLDGGLAYKLNAITLHHIIPGSKGGPTSENNLIPLCINCHAKWHTYCGPHTDLTEEQIYKIFLDWLLDFPKKEILQVKEKVELSSSKRQLVINETTEILLALKKHLKEKLNVEIQLILKQL